MNLTIRNSILKLAFSFTAMALLSIKTVSAQVETETFKYSGSLSSLSSTGNFSLPDFDPTLGALQNVELTLTLTGTTRVIVYNAQHKAIGFRNVTISVPGSLTGPGNLSINTAFTSPVTDGTDPYAKKEVVRGAGPFATDTVHVLTNNPGSTVYRFSDPDLLSLWSGQNNDVVSLAYNSTGAPASGHNLGNTIFYPNTFHGTAQISVKYTYDTAGVLPIPEPSAKYLALIAAFGLVLLQVARRKHASA